MEAKLNPCRLNSLSRYLAWNNQTCLGGPIKTSFLFFLSFAKRKLTSRVILDFVVDIKRMFWCKGIE